MLCRHGPRDARQAFITRERGAIEEGGRRYATSSKRRHPMRMYAREHTMSIRGYEILPSQQYENVAFSSLDDIIAGKRLHRARVILRRACLHIGDIEVMSRIWAAVIFLKDAYQR